jgi:hypothetical protein
MMQREIERLIDLVKFDYEHALGFIDGVVRVSIGIRTIAMAGCLALLAAALQTEQVILAAFAFVISIAFWAQDAYHGWLYAEARGRTVEMESLMGDYYRQLQGGASEVRRRQLLKRLRKHQLALKPSLHGPAGPKSRERQAEWRGETSRLTKITLRLRLRLLVVALRMIRRARPRIVYGLLYPLLAATCIAVFAVLLFGSGTGQDRPRPVQICVGCEVALPASHGHLGNTRIPER